MGRLAFSCGTDHMYWDNKNCSQCAKHDVRWYEDSEVPVTCPIAKHILDCSEMPEHLFKKMNAVTGGTWRCDDFEPQPVECGGFGDTPKRFRCSKTIDVFDKEAP